MVSGTQPFMGGHVSWWSSVAVEPGATALHITVEQKAENRPEVDLGSNLQGMSPVTYCLLEGHVTKVP